MVQPVKVLSEQADCAMLPKVNRLSRRLDDQGEGDIATQLGILTPLSHIEHSVIRMLLAHRFAEI